jgi:hypothetical protein
MTGRVVSDETLNALVVAVWWLNDQLSHSLGTAYFMNRCALIMRIQTQKINRDGMILWTE